MPARKIENPYPRVLTEDEKRLETMPCRATTDGRSNHKFGAEGSDPRIPGGNRCLYCDRTARMMLGGE